mgnify:CR=1 FL=1
MQQAQNYKSALTTLVTVFFFWGFIAASNGVFIPFCKTYFSLDQFQSQLIDFAFYGAYYIGALVLFMFSSILNSDVLNKWGYKNSIIYGLVLSAIGAGTMVSVVGGAQCHLPRLDIYGKLWYSLFDDRALAVALDPIALVERKKTFPYPP